MLDSSTPYAVSNMQDSRTRPETLERNKSGAPVASADGKVEWIRPSHDGPLTTGETIPESTSGDAKGYRESTLSHAGPVAKSQDYDDVRESSGDEDKEADSDIAQDANIPPLAGHNDIDVDVEKQQHIQDHNQSQEPAQKDEEEERDPNVVDWDGPDDPQNPMNFPPLRKWGIAVTFGMMTFVVTFASSVMSSTVMPTAMEFGVGSEVMVLATSLFVLG